MAPAAANAQQAASLPSKFGQVLNCSRISKFNIHEIISKEDARVVMITIFDYHAHLNSHLDFFCSA